jgi:predicted O-methyltransferase YrrM
MAPVKHDDLIEIFKTFNLEYSLQYQGYSDSLQLSNHAHPCSLEWREANIIYNVIINNNLKHGFEVATAFGISSGAIGQALKVTGGLLVTVDAYVEEIYNFCGAYTIDTRIINENPDGYVAAKLIHEHLNIQDHVILEKGWTPDCISDVITRNFKKKKLDFALIDGGHTFEQFEADVRGVIDYLKHDSVFIFHDFGSANTTSIEF